MITNVGMVTDQTFKLKYLIILYKIVRATNTLFDVMEAKKSTKFNIVSKKKENVYILQLRLFASA